MDKIDREILNEIQSDFPVIERPYMELGRRLNLSEYEVLERIKNLKHNGIIRRIGGNFDSDKLNFTSTLCAAKVPEDKLDIFVKIVNKHPGVTHNYLRDHEYNIWFTFIAKSQSEIEKALIKIKEETGIEEIINLPSLKRFKIKVDFEV